MLLHENREYHPQKKVFYGILCMFILSGLSFSMNFFHTPKCRFCPISTMSEQPPLLKHIDMGSFLNKTMVTKKAMLDSIAEVKRFN